MFLNNFSPAAHHNVSWTHHGTPQNDAPRRGLCDKYLCRYKFLPWKNADKWQQIMKPVEQRHPWWTNVFVYYDFSLWNKLFIVFLYKKSQNTWQIVAAHQCSAEDQLPNITQPTGKLEVRFSFACSICIAFLTLPVIYFKLQSSVLSLVIFINDLHFFRSLFFSLLSL